MEKKGSFTEKAEPTVTCRRKPSQNVLRKEGGKRGEGTYIKSTYGMGPSRREGKNWD